MLFKDTVSTKFLSAIDMQQIITLYGWQCNRIYLLTFSVCSKCSLLVAITLGDVLRREACAVVTMLILLGSSVK
jgi:hypothetical protein